MTLLDNLAENLRASPVGQERVLLGEAFLPGRAQPWRGPPIVARWARPAAAMVA
jgi:hypothetical protein